MHTLRALGFCNHAILVAPLVEHAAPRATFVQLIGPDLLSMNLEANHDSAIAASTGSPTAEISSPCCTVSLVGAQRGGIAPHHRSSVGSPPAVSQIHCRLQQRARHARAAAGIHGLGSPVASWRAGWPHSVAKKRCSLTVHRGVRNKHNAHNCRPGRSVAGGQGADNGVDTRAKLHPRAGGLPRRAIGVFPSDSTGGSRRPRGLDVAHQRGK